MPLFCSYGTIKATNREFSQIKLLLLGFDPDYFHRGSYSTPVVMLSNCHFLQNVASLLISLPFGMFQADLNTSTPVT